jgi:S1-C subfamily serine protease
VDPASGDFHVKQTSPAIALGFVNFPMGQFGVRRAELKAMARTPALAKLAVRATATGTPVAKPAMTIWQAGVRDISGLGDRSAHGLPDESGVLLLDVPVGSLAAGAGLQKDDVIVACNGQRRLTVRNLRSIIAAAAGQGIELLVIRQQKQISLTARAGGVGGAGSQ